MGIVEMDVKQKSSYRELLPEKEYLKNLLATVAGRLGDSIDAIAFSWMVYTITGSASLTAVTYGVNTLVSVFLQPFSGALVTNMNKKAVIVLAESLRATLVCLCAVLYFTGLVQPWMLIVATGLVSTFEAFRMPAGTALLPQIIPKQKYTLAMSLTAAASRTAEIIGTGLAGIAIALLGIGGALMIDAAAFFLSAAILATLRLPPHVKQKAENGFAEFLKSTKEGFQYVGGHKLILAICVSACVLNFAFAPFSALQTAFVNESLQLGAQALSGMGIAIAAGMAVGSVLFPKAAAHATRFRLLCMGAIVLCVSYASLAFIPLAQADLTKWILLIAVIFVMGMGLAFTNTSVHVSFMEKTEEAYLARVQGIMNSMCLAAIPVASFLVAIFAKFTSVTSLIFWSGILSLAGALIMMRVKVLRDL